jgi:hypothetical protein
MTYKFCRLMEFASFITVKATEEQLPSEMR